MKSKKQNKESHWITLILAVIVIAILIITFNSWNSKFNLYEQHFSNYTIIEEQENHSIITYNQSIEFTLAPVEEYSINSIVSLISINKLDPICDKNSEEYRNSFGRGYMYPSSFIQEVQASYHCFDMKTTQRITKYHIIDNVNIRQIGDTLKNLDIQRQNITIVVEIENDTKYFTKVKVTKVNETLDLIAVNESGWILGFINLNSDWLNKNTKCINSYCPKGYENLLFTEKCIKFSYWTYKTIEKQRLCNKWIYQDKYIVEEVK